MKLLDSIKRLWSGQGNGPSAQAAPAAALVSQPGAGDGLPAVETIRGARPSSTRRVLAQRERLLRGGLQLVGDREAALELTSACLLAALRSPMLLSFSDDAAGEDALWQWLERMLVQRALRRLREATPSRRLIGQDPETPESAEAGDGDGAAAAAVAPVDRSRKASDERPRDDRSRPAELLHLQRTAQAVAALPPLSRLSVILVVMQRRPLAEAAELLGCSHDTCAFWLVQGRKQLRRALQRDLLPIDDGELDARPPQPVAVPGALHELRRSKKAIARA